MIEAKLEYRFLSPPLKFGVDQLLDQITSQRFGKNELNYSQFIQACGQPLKGHNGEDHPHAEGAPVLAAHSGKVVKINDNVSQGYGIWLLGPEMELEGAKVRPRTSYWHLKGFNCQVGDEIQVGQVIGYVDSTGYSTGDHLHFGIKFLYPDGKDVFPCNGYDGYVDPRPFYLNRWSPGPIAGTTTLTNNDEPMQFQKASIEEKRVFAVFSGKRWWILDPKSLQALEGDVKVNPNLYQLPYGGAIFVSQTDDPVSY